jgi:hypothetical protein
MTTDLEKQFFSTFGIEPKTEICWCDSDNKICECEYDCDELRRSRKIGYPQITDRILLELICIDFNENPYKCRGGQTSVDEVKERILSDFIHEFENNLYLDKENIKHQVRTLFEEG